jgi:hypothetical protein
LSCEQNGITSHAESNGSINRKTSLVDSLRVAVSLASNFGSGVMQYPCIDTTRSNSIEFDLSTLPLSLHLAHPDRPAVRFVIIIPPSIFIDLEFKVRILHPRPILVLGLLIGFGFPGPASAVREEEIDGFKPTAVERDQRLELGGV